MNFASVCLASPEPIYVRSMAANSRPLSGSLLRDVNRIMGRLIREWGKSDVFQAISNAVYELCEADGEGSLTEISEYAKRQGVNPDVIDQAVKHGRDRWNRLQSGAASGNGTPQQKIDVNDVLRECEAPDNDEFNYQEFENALNAIEHAIVGKSQTEKLRAFCVASLKQVWPLIERGMISLALATEQLDKIARAQKGFGLSKPDIEHIVNELIRGNMPVTDGHDGKKAHHSEDYGHGEVTPARREQRTDLCPLPDALPPVVPFDLDLMPEQLRPWARDVSERMQVPADFVAVSLIAALGSIIARKVVVRPQANDDWEVHCNQWALLIGRPGVLKSPAMQQAMKPIARLAALAEEEFKQAQSGRALDTKVAKILQAANLKEAEKLLKKNRDASVGHLLGEGEPPEPTLKRYTANDTNVASLGVLLEQNPNGLLVFRDEMVSLLASLDREENASERGFYLTGWNGDSAYTFDRIGRGLHLHIGGVCISMLGSTQPGRIAEYLADAVRGGRGDDGLIQRFGLMVWPDVPSTWINVDRPPDKEAGAAAFAVFDRLDALDWHAIGAHRDRGLDGDEKGVPYLRLSIDAYDVFLAWRTNLEHRLRSGEMHAALESHLAKYRKLVPGLALICHLADGGTGLIGVASIRRAIAWAEYLESHARRAYGSGPTATAATAKAILAKIQSGDIKPEFRSHDVWRPAWSKLSDRDAVVAGLAMLEEYGWISARTVKTAGRSATIYTIDPKALKK